MIAYRTLCKKILQNIQKMVTVPLDTALLFHFILKGKKPFIRGYDIFKRRVVCKALASEHFPIDALPKRHGIFIDERIVEYPWLFSRLPAAEPGTLLDAGSVLNFDYILRHNSLRNKKLFIATLAPENQAFWEQGISYIYDDLRSTCFRSDYFNWIVSLSTLEHVGMDNTTYYTDDFSKKESKAQDYLSVIAEYRRILKPGGTCYLSVPFGAKKAHEWLQVFDLAMVESMIKAFAPDFHAVHYFRYTPQEGWSVATAQQCADAIYHDFHIDGYRRDRPAAAEAVACIELRK